MATGTSEPGAGAAVLRGRGREKGSVLIPARMSTSLDGFGTTPTGWPALTADPAFRPRQSHGIRES